MRPVNLEAVAEVAGALNQLGVDFALTGGVVVAFLLDYPDVVIVRPTDDVDAIAAVVNLVLTAFEDRGGGDYFSHDLEDIITVIDGRLKLVDEIAAEESSIRNYISEMLRGLMRDQRFLDVLPGHLGGDETHQKRLPQLIRRLEVIAGIVT